MRRLLVMLAVTAVAAAVLAPTASARAHIALRYLGLQTSDHAVDRAAVSARPRITLRYTAVLDEKSAHVNLKSRAISFRALLYVPRGIAGSVRFSLRDGRGDSLVFGARLRFREGTVFARGHQRTHPGRPPQRDRRYAPLSRRPR